MKIEVRHIPQQGITLSYLKDAREFISMRELVEAGEIEFAAPVDIALDVMSERDSIRLQGQLDTVVRLRCSRCTKMYEQALTSRFKLQYSHQIPIDVNRAEQDDIELTAEQIGLNYYNGEEIDFTDAVQEQLVLALPYKPLCREDCAGLCPGCGADLNEEGCRCDSVGTGSPFEVLKNLKLTH